MREKSLSRSDRVAIEPEMHDVYKRLSEGTDAEELPFRELKDVFMMAACLGYTMRERRALAAGRRDIIRWETLSPQVDIPVLYALAIAETGNVEILDEGFEMLTIAEEFANAGIRFLAESVLNQGGHPLWNLVSLIQQKTIPIPGKNQRLGGIRGD